MNAITTKRLIYIDEGDFIRIKAVPRNEALKGENMSAGRKTGSKNKAMSSYTLDLMDQNAAADTENIGVRLGRLCIELRVPLLEVSEIFGVDKQTIRLWFLGKAYPRGRQYEKIIGYIKELEYRKQEKCSNNKNAVDLEFIYHEPRN